MNKPSTSAILFVLIIGIISSNSCSFTTTNPPQDFDNVNLIGTWTTHYSIETTDTITISPDGTFRQVFEDLGIGYSFDSGLGQWSLEKLSNGINHLHLQGGRYYLEGTPLAEKDGRKNPDNPCFESDCDWGLQPRLFYDPFADELTQMVDELILVVQVGSKGELILHHLWTSSDRGFLLIGSDREFFQKEKDGF